MKPESLEQIGNAGGKTCPSGLHVLETASGRGLPPTCSLDLASEGLPLIQLSYCGTDERPAQLQSKA